LLPEEIESDERIELPVTPQSVVVLGREDGPEDG
jgi:hypothetical protein